MSILRSLQITLLLLRIVGISRDADNGKHGTSSDKKSFFSHRFVRAEYANDHD